MYIYIFFKGKNRMKHKLVPWNECYKTRRLYRKSDDQSIIHFNLNINKIESKKMNEKWMLNRNEYLKGKRDLSPHTGIESKQNKKGLVCVCTIINNQMGKVFSFLLDHQKSFIINIKPAFFSPSTSDSMEKAACVCCCVGLMFFFSLFTSLYIYSNKWKKKRNIFINNNFIEMTKPSGGFFYFFFHLF